MLIEVLHVFGESLTFGGAGGIGQLIHAGLHILQTVACQQGRNKSRFVRPSFGGRKIALREKTPGAGAG